MNKFAIAAVAAALLASTSVSFAEDDTQLYQSALAFNQQQYANPPATAAKFRVNNVRDARAQATAVKHAVKPVTAEENAWFARTTPSLIGN